MTLISCEEGQNMDNSGIDIQPFDVLIPMFDKDSNIRDKLDNKKKIQDSRT